MVLIFPDRSARAERVGKSVRRKAGTLAPHLTTTT